MWPGATPAAGRLAGEIIILEAQIVEFGSSDVNEIQP